MLEAQEEIHQIRIMEDSGGAGKASSITGSPVTRAGGGGGGIGNNSIGSNGTGAAGGGDGTAGSSQNPGTANTGSGGGGGGSGGLGGSGIVILRYPNAFTISNPGGGLSYPPPLMDHLKSPHLLLELVTFLGLDNYGTLRIFKRKQYSHRSNHWCGGGI